MWGLILPFARNGIKNLTFNTSKRQYHLFKSSHQLPTSAMYM